MSMLTCTMLQLVGSGSTLSLSSVHDECVESPVTEERIYRENAEFLARISEQQEEEEAELVEVEVDEEVEGGVVWVCGRGMTGVAMWPMTPPAP